MENTIRNAFFIVSIFLFSFLYVSAQVSERINIFNSDITINTDGSINIVETIKYNSGGLQKHGIFRDIRLKSYNNQNLIISNISITNEYGIPYKYSQSHLPEKISLKIGDAGNTFLGDKNYIIKYKIFNAIGFFDKYDEIYWNSTGNEWQFPIDHSSTVVHLPNGASIQKSASYCGMKATNTPCTDNGNGSFSYDNILNTGEGMTIAVSFPKGIVNNEINFLNYLFECIPILIPIFTFLILYKKWKKYGKDPKSNNTIIAEYDVPDSLTPIEVAKIIGFKNDSKSISAEIINLAIGGYIKIEKIQDEILFIKSDNYVLSRISSDTPPSDADKMLLDAIFINNVTEIKMSALKYKFYKNIPKIIKNVFEKMVTSGYLKNNNSLIVKCVLAGSIFIILGFKISSNGIFPIPILNICLFLSSAIIFFFSFIMPARTEKGLRTKEYLFGLKEYLNIAEKDRINFHNAPEKKPEIFEKLLPYAMIFGVEKAWAKEFDGIYTQSPRWYSDSHALVFNVVIFTNSLQSFSDYSNRIISAAPGGSSGGGFSGGGGGGGGGGSW